MAKVTVGNLELTEDEVRLYLVVKTAVDEAIRQHSIQCPMSKSIENLDMDINGKPGNGGGLKNKIIQMKKDLDDILKIRTLMIGASITAFFTFMVSLTLLLISVFVK